MAQHFLIKKDSTLPILTMKVVNDGRYDYKDIFDRLENAAITFSMVDEKTPNSSYHYEEIYTQFSPK